MSCRDSIMRRYNNCGLENVLWRPNKVFFKAMASNSLYFQIAYLKNERLERVENYIDAVHHLSAILGMDYSTIITNVHPSLNELCGISKNISNSILAKLNSTVESLEEEKQKRLEKVIITYLWC